MTKKKKPIIDVENIEIEKEQVFKKVYPTKEYVLKKDFIKNDGTTLKKGEKISLTIEAYKFFSQKNII